MANKDVFARMALLSKTKGNNIVLTVTPAGKWFIQEGWGVGSQREEDWIATPHEGVDALLKKARDELGERRAAYEENAKALDRSLDELDGI